MCPASTTPVKYVRGVGPRVAEMLAAKGIQTAEDLLYHLPFRYEDRQNPRSLDELKAGETASVIAEVRGSALLRTRKMPIFELTVGQGRLALKCIWFNGSYLKGKFHAGQTVAVYGKVEPSRSSQNFKMIQPQFEMLPGRERRRRNAAARSGAHHAGLRVAGRRAAGFALAAEDDLQSAGSGARRGAGVPAARNAGAARSAGSRDGAARGAFSARGNALLRSCKARRRPPTGG